MALASVAGPWMNAGAAAQGHAAVGGSRAGLRQPTPSANRVEVLRPNGGVPAHVAGHVREPFGFQQAPGGHFLVFDRRAHAVWRIAADYSDARAIITIGHEEGRLFSPSAFAVGASGVFVVADAPGDRERIQSFDEHGSRLAAFTLPGRAAARVTLGTTVLSGVSSLELAGTSILLNRPEDGALVSEYSMTGSPVRSFGALRRTGHEQDRDLHLAFNVGVPLHVPGGGTYFVFLTGEPRFRKYDAKGTLRFERLMQGPEIDAILARLPDTWPRRVVDDDELPLVPPTVRTAAVDPDGYLWVALPDGVLYVFDPEGEKVRVVRLEATGVLLANSLAFASRTRLLVTPGLYEFRAR